MVQVEVWFKEPSYPVTGIWDGYEAQVEEVIASNERMARSAARSIALKKIGSQKYRLLKMTIGEPVKIEEGHNVSSKSV